MMFLAIRYLLARRRQTLFTLLGILFGTTAFIAISGLMLGFREYLIAQLINNNPHVVIQAREDFLTAHQLDTPFYGDRFRHIFWDPPPSGRNDSAMIDDPQRWAARLAADPRVAAFSPQLTAAVIFSHGKATVPATLTGCDPLQRARVTTIANYVTNGRFADLAAGGNRVIIGAELQRRLGVQLLQNITVASSAGEVVPFQVVGIFKEGSRQSDRAAYAALADVQKINHTPNHVSEIVVRLRDHTTAAAIAGTWASLGPDTVESWDQRNANLFDVFAVQDAIRYLTISAILMVAGFGIYNVLAMTVMQKRRDIAILRSMGYGAGDIVALFFLQGAMLGIGGTLGGVGCGYAICRYLQTVPFSGGPLRVSTGHLIVSLDPMIYAKAVTMGVVAACIASWLPARAAGKLTPIEIIRTGTD